MVPRIRSIPLALALAFGAIPIASSAEVIPSAVPDLPVLGAQVPRGDGLVTWPVAPITPTAKVIDGAIDDWIGEPTNFAGTQLYGAGELVYSDYLMDDWGADDGADANRAEITDATAEAEPRLYRTEALAQAFGDQFGIPGPGEVSAVARYGDAPYPDGLEDQADLTEVRVAADADRLIVLARVQAMRDPVRTAIVVLVDTADGGSYPAPGGTTTAAEYAFLVTGSTVFSATDRGQPIAGCPPCSGLVAAADPSGFTNAIELSIDRSLIGDPDGQIRIGLAAGVSADDGTGLADVSPTDGAADLLNVAFRADEPTRVWMDHDQAFALLEGSIDRFLTPVNLDALVGGATRGFEPKPGYWERIYRSDSPVNAERESKDYFQGPFQQYGLYLPTSYRSGSPSKATIWLHYNGGHAHDAAAWTPGVLRQLGESRGSIVISPGARGTTSGYTGRGYVDFLEVYDDAMSSFSIDRDRVVLGGYSLGGFGAYLYGVLRPDLFSAVFPVVGPAAAREPGFPGVPITSLDEPFMTLQTVFENVRNTPFAIFQGTNDEIIPYADVARQATRLTELGYRHRFYTFPGYEHYSFAVVDDWIDAARYLDGFRRDPDPRSVTYRVWPAMERLVETDNAPVPLDFSFDSAYWASELAVRDGDPVDPATIGSFHGTTFARGDVPLVVPSVATAGQAQPYIATGIDWLPGSTPSPRNGFEVLAANLARARIDLSRMSVATAEPIEAVITTDGPFDLILAGAWSGVPTVTGATIIDASATAVRLRFPAGTHQLVVVP